MTPQEIAGRAVERMNRRLTDEIFLLIQDDRELMHEYLRAVESEGLDNVNRLIGRAVREAYQLENAPERENNPRSTLIQSHKIFMPSFPRDS